jgi:hypothetical protein
MVAFSRTWRFWVRSGVIAIPILPNSSLAQSLGAAAGSRDKNGRPEIGAPVLAHKVLMFEHRGLDTRSGLDTGMNSSCAHSTWDREPLHCERTGCVNVKLH